MSVGGLRKLLVDSIRLRGAMSIAQFMREALLHPVHGYYTRSERPVFGAAGDFVTSVEVSPMFCGLLGAWTSNAWTALQSPAVVRVVELGPGLGTLMQATLRALQRSLPSSVTVDTHLVEASAPLQTTQRQLLQPLLSHNRTLTHHTSISTLPLEGPFIFIAHEYFDALPIYRFHYTPDKGWCEELVDIDVETGKLRFVLSPGPTPATTICLGRNAPTSPSPIEVSPDMQSVMEIIARRSQRDSVGLVIDYGSEGPPGRSLRAIRAHAFEDPLDNPGEADLSADVDFRMLANVCRKQRLRTRSCSQREFLERMGIDVLLMQQLKGCRNDAEATAVMSEFNRVVNQMGTSYRAMEFASNDAIMNRL